MKIGTDVSFIEIRVSTSHESHESHEKALFRYLCCNIYMETHFYLKRILLLTIIMQAGSSAITNTLSFANNILHIVPNIGTGLKTDGLQNHNL
jgi:hypothetical protein